MYEVFPLVAGVVMALVVPRVATGTARKVAYAVLATVVAVAATIIAGEAWFFVFVDLAEVILAVGATLAVKARLPRDAARRETVDVR